MCFENLLHVLVFKERLNSIMIEVHTALLVRYI